MAVTKLDLVKRITESTGEPRKLVKTIVQDFLGEITSELAANNRLEFRDFGMFEVRARAARTAQNPKTLKPVEVPAKRFVKFKMGKGMKERLNDGESHEQPIHSSDDMIQE